MTKEKNNKPSKELPLGFVDRNEKELLVRDFIVSNIKEIMIKYGFQYLETPSFEYSDSIGKFYRIKTDQMRAFFHLRMKTNGYR